MTMFQTMTVDQLRKLAKDKGFVGAERYTYSKAELITYLETGKMRPTPEPVAVNAPASPEAALEALRVLLGSAGGSGISEARVIELIKENTVQTIEVITAPGREPVNVGVQHCLFPKILKLANMKTAAGKRYMDCMLVGPAGSGKTTLAKAIATSIGVPLYAIPVGLMTTQSQLIGYQSASGCFVPSAIYSAYRDGGVVLLDELDGANPGVTTILNSLLDNGEYRFPGGEVIERHADFYCIAAANTYGLGADRVYAGRNQMDGALRERFAFIDFGYDEALERKLAGETSWTRKVRRIRAKVLAAGEKVIVSPRASIKGNALIADGFSEDEVADMVIWKGCAPEIKARCNA